jgi:hypothetical protein
LSWDSARLRDCRCKSRTITWNECSNSRRCRGITNDNLSWHRARLRDCRCKSWTIAGNNSRGGRGRESRECYYRRRGSCIARRGRGGHRTSSCTAWRKPKHKNPAKSATDFVGIANTLRITPSWIRDIWRWTIILESIATEALVCILYTKIPVPYTDLGAELVGHIYRIVNLLSAKVPHVKSICIATEGLIAGKCGDSLRW